LRGELGLAVEGEDITRLHMGLHLNEVGGPISGVKVELDLGPSDAKDNPWKTCPIKLWAARIRLQSLQCGLFQQLRPCLSHTGPDRFRQLASVRLVLRSY
jgi:hypothetical protein